MKVINSPLIKKSRYQKNISEKVFQCLTCERRCILNFNKTGYCKTRINLNGIYTLVYGCIPAISINPIEKKPLFHFHPSSEALTIGTFGCNFDCFWCQNDHLSHPDTPILEKINLEKKYLSPERLIEIAKVNKCQGISISFNEPTLLFEYSLDAFNLAKKEGLYNTYVSNGYMTEDVLRDLINAGLDAINIDIKGSLDIVKKYCGIDVKKVWRNARIAKEEGVHVEITTLLIEDLNSKDEIIKTIVERIIEDLGEFTPFHITRFFPHYKSNQYGIYSPTRIELLYNAYNIAKNLGLKFVYLGNLVGTEYENTNCPSCSKNVIKRSGFRVQKFKIDSEGNCQFCGFPICII